MTSQTQLPRPDMHLVFRELLHDAACGQNMITSSLLHSADEILQAVNGADDYCLEIIKHPTKKESKFNDLVSLGERLLNEDSDETGVVFRYEKLEHRIKDGVTVAFVRVLWGECDTVEVEYDDGSVATETSKSYEERGDELYDTLVASVYAIIVAIVIRYVLYVL